MVPAGEHPGGRADLADLGRADMGGERGRFGAVEQGRDRGESDGTDAEGGGAQELLAVHVGHLYHRATLVAQPQCGVAGNSQDRPQCLPVAGGRPADHAAFELADVVGVQLDALLGVIPQIGVDQLREFLPGQALARLGRRLGPLPRPS